MITTINEYKLYLESKSNRLDILKQHLDRDNISLAQWIINSGLVKFNGKLTEKEAVKIIKSVDYHSFYDKLPTMYFFDSPAQDVPDGKWLMHFSIHPKGISRYGFNRGQPNYLKLGMTHGSKLQSPQPGYNFAFDPKDAKIKYGSLQEAFWTWSTYHGGVAFFKAPAIKAYHFGDEVDQVIFWGRDAHDIIVAYINEDDTWKMNGKIFKTLDEVYKYLTSINEKYNRRFFDNPREVIKAHKDYSKLVKLAKDNKNNPERLRDTLIKWFDKNEKWLAQNVFCSKDEDYIYCDHAGEMLGQIFTDASIAHTLQVGVIRGQSHMWARIGDVIFDPTSSQLSDTSLSAYDNADDLSTTNFNEFGKRLNESFVDTERIWLGREVNQHIKDITPSVHDIPDYFMDKVIKHRKFKIQPIDLNNLLVTDPSFKEYYDSGESRYEDADENDDHMPHPDDINYEIVVVDGELLDGYNRVSSLLRMGEKTTYGFVAI